MYKLIQIDTYINKKKVSINDAPLVMAMYRELVLLNPSSISFIHVLPPSQTCSHHRCIIMELIEFN